MNEGNLFSIDVEAHLKKAASHTFGSAAHYPVELVRAALRRGATQVDIDMTRQRLRVQDNGPGLEPHALQTLTTLMDPKQPEALKEEAVESIQTHEGMGLLAIFAANPEEILVENVSDAGKTQLHFKKNHFTTSSSLTASLTAGTRITLISSHRDVDREKQLLEAFCRSVPRQVRLNQRLLGRQPFLVGQLATVPLTPSKYASIGQVGIPQTGRICHIRLLDQGIPWHHFTLPPQEGFIFDAAIETGGEVTMDLLKHLGQYAEHLYQWLAKRYSAAEPAHQERIEELLFTHCRLAGDDSLILEFAPFSILNSPHFLNLRQVREKAAAGSLYAVPWHKGHLRYNTSGKTVLSLTREQADLLINYLNIPLIFLSPVTRRPNPIPRFWYALKKHYKRFILGLLPTPKKVLDTSQLTKPEQLFIFKLQRCLSGQSRFSFFHSPGIQVEFIPSRKPFPVVLPGKNKKKLFIRRQHPLVQKAVHAVQADPQNIEIFVPLIIY